MECFPFTTIFVLIHHLTFIIQSNPRGTHVVDAKLLPADGEGIDRARQRQGAPITAGDRSRRDRHSDPADGEPVDIGKVVEDTGIAVDQMFRFPPYSPRRRVRSWQGPPKSKAMLILLVQSSLPVPPASPSVWTVASPFVDPVGLHQ